MKELVYLRGHHLRILYEYALFSTYTDRPNLRKLRTKMKDRRVINAAIEDKHSKKHGINITKVMKTAIKPGVKIRLVDTIDDVCATCNNKNKRSCKEFIPYDISATCDDRAVLRYYGLKKREYNSEFIVERVIKKGIDP